MLPHSRRYLLVIGLLLAGVALTWGQRWTAAGALPAIPPTQVEGAKPLTETPEHIYFVDVEGWYRITAYETVVRSAYDLSGDSTEEIAAALPASLGDWVQSGEDQYIADEPAVVYYLKHPTIALQRTYRGPTGQTVTLAILGNKGEDSYLLFSHTPETCYPGRLWQVIENRRESALLDAQPMHAQYILTEHAQNGRRLMVLFWYLWDNPQRDSKDGVLSMRVNLYLDLDQTEQEALDQAWAFVRAIFPATVPWDRF